MRRYILDNIGILIIFLLSLAVLLLSFSLFHLPLEAVWYPMALTLLIILTYGVYRYFRHRKKLAELERLTNIHQDLLSALSKYRGSGDAAYHKLISALIADKNRAQLEAEENYADMVDYYTTWVHQVKMPIASMRLTLSDEDTELSRRLADDLFRIEQYVEMVLCYLRLDSDTSDYLFREYDLDELVRASIRKYRSQFISSGTRLVYEPTPANSKTNGANATDEHGSPLSCETAPATTESQAATATDGHSEEITKIVTDEKWFAFAFEQVLSNALKYTRKGEIRIYQEDGWLCISDTGIGIAPEDLPRIFEKGYTGFNGRVDKSASGLGLYLTSRTLKNLGHALKAESTLGKGTTIKIGLKQERRVYE